MDNSVLVHDHLHHNPISSSRTHSQRDVQYSCGRCGYDLNLSSSNRNTSSMIIGSKYGKSIKRGMLSFFTIDDTKFTQADEIECGPHFSKHSWGLFRRKTKLLCRKCCNHIGNAYNGYSSSSASFPLVVSNGAAGPSPNNPANKEATTCLKYDIRLRALQPLLSFQQ